MRSIRFLPRFAKFIILCAILIVLPGMAGARQAGTVTATGTIEDIVPLTFDFSPTGGSVTANVISTADVGKDYPCVVTRKIKLEGTFAGGDGGSISGTVEYELQGECVWTTEPLPGIWSGNLYANGTGSGSMHFDSELFGEFSYGWKVTFSAQEFQAALSAADSATAAPEAPASEPVSAEAIYNTYGIKVEDTFSEDPSVSKSWSGEELVLLNDVLKELPPQLVKKLAVTRIVRSVRDPDHPDWVGGYYPCDGSVGKEPCTAETAAIRIYDGAFQPFDFTDDPNGYKEFKGTILHEMTHALQAYTGPNGGIVDPTKEVARNYYSSPLLQNYMDATRPVTNMDDPGFWGNNGWNLLRGQWKLTGVPGNLTPTNYARTNPAEDLCESVMMYVYEPQKLQTSSAKRYNFIRDQIFGGVEYEKGIQK